MFAQPLQFSQCLVLELAIEVFSHMSNASPTLNIWSPCLSLVLLATIFYVIDCLQNTFVPIVYAIHVLHILHHCHLQSRNRYQLSPFSLSTKAIGNDSNWLLLLAATAIVARIVSLYFSVRKMSYIQRTGRQCQNAWMKAPNAINEHRSTNLFGFYTQL
jgi:hypothetical protein